METPSFPTRYAREVFTEEDARAIVEKMNIIYEASKNLAVVI